MRRIGYFCATFGAFAAFWLSANPPYPIFGCPCDEGNPRSLDQTVCGLCGGGQGHTDAYVVRDASPAKPNRLLALPPHHAVELADLRLDQRTALWTAAIVAARKNFDEDWALAQNSVLFRTQCHAHIHIGRLDPEYRHSGGTIIASPADLPATTTFQGIWVHPRDNGYCFHLDRLHPEALLQR